MASENRIYDYIGLLREAAEIVALNPLLGAPNSRQPAISL
jgi:hypothetical protein